MFLLEGAREHVTEACNGGDGVESDMGVVITQPRARQLRQARHVRARGLRTALRCPQHSGHACPSLSPVSRPDQRRQEGQDRRKNCLAEGLHYALQRLISDEERLVVINALVVLATAPLKHMNNAPKGGAESCRSHGGTCC